MSQQVLVLDCYEHTLTIIRSLAHAGFEVILGVCAEDLERGYVHVSRFVSSTWLHSDIVAEAGAFESELLKYLQQNPRTKTVYPVGENSVRQLCAMRDELPADVLIAMPETAAVETCLHKPSAYRLADQCAIPIPGTRTVRSAKEMRVAVSELGFPAIAKPLDSTNLLLKKKCVFIRSNDDAEKLFTNWPDDGNEYVVQNEIKGVRHNCDVVAENGEIKLYFEAEILRTDQLDYAGNSVFDWSIPPNPLHREYCERFIAQLNYTGLTLIQFLRDPLTGTSYFLEANPRAGAAIALATNCGIDLPYATVSACAGNLSVGDNSYPLYRTRECLHDDLLGIRKARVNREIGFRGSLSWLGRAFIDTIRANYYSTFVWNDPKPTFKLYWDLLTRLVFKDKRGLNARTQERT